METVAVIDIGKTNVKVALVDPARAAEIAVETQANTVRAGPPWPHYDTEAIWDFIVGSLCRLSREARIDGLVVATHGASGAVLTADGRLAASVLDYEHDGPDAVRPAYEALRPPFAETGSPALPGGLNLGAQLHWMLGRDRDLPARTAHVVPWPQYWGFRLTGRLASDVSSLGSHTDLWNPGQRTWSSLPATLGLAGRMAPPQLPSAVLGMLLPAVQAATGLGPVPVLTGIHDSNASLVPHLGLARPFAVVSTGTWVIAMAVGGRAVPLDPARDTLVNVDATGAAVPSARFMGGREFEVVMQGADAAPTGADPVMERRVIEGGVMLLPSVVAGCGPFPASRHVWTAEPQSAAERSIAAGHYLALMTAECLALIGAEGPVIVEGPFCANRPFLAMLAAATGRAVQAAASRTGTAVGAAQLFGGGQGRGTALAPPVVADPALVDLAAAWRRALRAHIAGR